MNFKKGFTLIELLVAVGLIALLSSVVLTQIDKSRSKGKDGAIKSNMSTARNASEIFFLNNNNTYIRASFAGSGLSTSVCPSAPNFGAGIYMLNYDPGFYNALAEALRKGNGSSNCYNSDNVWAVAIGLNLTPTQSWCVDSKPSAKVVSAVPSAAINGTTHLCN